DRDRVACTLRRHASRDRQARPAHAWCPSCFPDPETHRHLAEENTPADTFTGRSVRSVSSPSGGNCIHDCRDTATVPASFWALSGRLHTISLRKARPSQCGERPAPLVPGSSAARTVQTREPAEDVRCRRPMAPAVPTGAECRAMNGDAAPVVGGGFRASREAIAAVAGTVPPPARPEASRGP